MRPNVVRIEEVRAQFGDDPALTKLLASIPFPPSVRPLLAKRFLGRKWNGVRKWDYWLASDGANVVSLRITGASADVIARVRLRFDELFESTPGLEPSRKTLRQLIAAT